MHKSIFPVESALCPMPDGSLGWGGDRGAHSERGWTLLLPGAGLGAAAFVRCRRAAAAAGGMLRAELQHGQSLKNSSFSSMAGRSPCAALGLLWVRHI